MPIKQQIVLIRQQAMPPQQTRQAASGLEGAFANLERSMQGYANQMTKDLKVCTFVNPRCEWDAVPKSRAFPFVDFG